MGVHKNISYEKFPKQGSFLGRIVEVCFNYDTSKTITGEIVRDDDDEPGLMIIKLDDDRFVLSSECQYSLNAIQDNEKAVPTSEHSENG